MEAYNSNDKSVEVPRDALEFPTSRRDFLESYLPPNHASTHSVDRPFVTLTFATSLDSSLSLSPGIPTAISGPQSKAMTHYLRSRHDGILIGVGTAMADDPSLNCRLAGVGGYGSEGLDRQPRPIILDPHARWDFTENSKLFKLCRDNRGRAPWIITTTSQVPAEKQALLEKSGGRYIMVDDVMPSDDRQHHVNWSHVLEHLRDGGLQSVMIEGGGRVINSLLEPRWLTCVDSVIITIAPTWLGRGGVVVSPERRRNEDGNAIPAARLKKVTWNPLGEDVVLCGVIKG